MDPDATLQELVEALGELQNDHSDLDSRGQAVDCLRNLAAWLEQGGFPPTSDHGFSTEDK